METEEPMGLARPWFRENGVVREDGKVLRGWQGHGSVKMGLSVKTEEPYETGNAVETRLSVKVEEPLKAGKAMGP